MKEIYIRYLLFGVLVLTLCIAFTFFVMPTTHETFVTTNNDGSVITHTFGDFSITEYPQLLTSDECKRIIQLAKEHGMKESDVLTYGKPSDTEVNTNHRKSKQAWIPDEKDPIFTKFAELTQIHSGIPKQNQEQSQVVVYDPNGKFDEHYDSCVYEDQEYCKRINNNAGQRRSTLLLYLNDDYDGGETEFTEIGLVIKPKAGKAIQFWSTDENENLLKKSKHRARPVLNGNKWICTKWSHPKEWKHPTS